MIEPVEEVPAVETGEVAEKAVAGVNAEIYRRAIEPLLATPLNKKQVENIEEYLEQIEKIVEELNADRFGTGEAIRRLRNISAKMSG